VPVEKKRSYSLRQDSTADNRLGATAECDDGINLFLHQSERGKRGGKTQVVLDRGGTHRIVSSSKKKNTELLLKEVGGRMRKKKKPKSGWVVVTVGGGRKGGRTRRLRNVKKRKGKYESRNRRSLWDSQEKNS